MRLAIHQNKNIYDHPATWDEIWIKFCEDNDIEYEIIDCFRTDIIAVLRKFDIVVWHYQNYVLQEMMFARSILNIAQGMGLKVFPDFNSSWHYDDKISESLLLRSCNSPIPDFWFFSEKNKALDWIEKDASFPLIAKLKCGAGSHNVKLIKSKSQAVKYINRMFGKGYKSSPNLLFKASSNFRSAKSLEEKRKRISKIPKFLLTLSRSRRFGRERDYVYFQDFIPNKGYDLKIIVIGEKAFFFARPIRSGDFRASGGGTALYDRTLVPKNVVISAFETSDKLKFQCMGYDFVVDERSYEGKIIEMSYGFSYEYLEKGSGYWDRNFVWHEEKINLASEIIRSLLKLEN